MNPERIVVLGGKEFEIGPIDLGTLKLIGIGCQRAATGGTDKVVSEAAWYDGSFDVLAAGLKLDRAAVEKLENVTLGEIIAATKKIYIITGLVTEKAAPKKPGEELGAKTG